MRSVSLQDYRRAVVNLFERNRLLQREGQSFVTVLKLSTVGCVCVREVVLKL